jgi:hypothetical protein
VTKAETAIRSFSFIFETDNLESNLDLKMANDSVTSWTQSVLRYQDAVGVLDIEVAVVCGAGDELIGSLLAILELSFPGRVSLLDGAGLDYYGKKMLGGERASNEYLVFIDSDVIYSSDWFSTMAPELEIVGTDVLYGTTFALPGGRRENSVALAWQFPVDEPWDVRQHYVEHRWSNNWAVRRSFLLENPIPFPAPGVKVGGVLFDFEAEERGTKIRSCYAKAWHAQPTHLREWLTTARSYGHGKVIQWRYRQESWRWLLIPEILGFELWGQLQRLKPALVAAGFSFSLPFYMILVFSRHIGVLWGALEEGFRLTGRAPYRASN